MTKVKDDPEKDEKDFDLMSVDYVFFFKNDLQEVSTFVRQCENNQKLRVEFIHKYTKEDSFCVGVLQKY